MSLHPSLSTQLPYKPCEQQVILWLANKVTGWKFIARWLGLEESDIWRIIEEHPNSVREQCYQMLLRWREMDPHNYNYHVLGDALLKEDTGFYAELVEEVHGKEKTLSNASDKTLTAV